ncbi:FkbM family methyltransferase [Candidatus Pelagibacter ubique]|nr:FkbM family methyltransferase [Candidatus Pelagibacter ubique]
MKLSYILKYIKGIAIYTKVPVYNLNWLKKTSFYDKILNESTITLIDVGARNVSVEELAPLQKHIRYIGFDADVNEVQRLNSKENGYKESQFIPSYVGRKNSFVKFGIHYAGDNSSIFPFGKIYNKWFRSGDENYIKKFIELKSSSLDELINENVDVIKLDTQGSEYEILKDSKNCLNSAMMVEVEVEFVQMYEGQKLAHNVFELMYSNGYELLYLNRVFSQSKRFRGESRGQMIFGDALFGITREKALNLSFDKKVKYVALLLNYGHIDFAFDLYENSEDLQTQVPQLKTFFNQKNKRNRLKIIFKLIIDKIVFVLLTLRKSNGLRNDSDRSWPIR